MAVVTWPNGHMGARMIPVAIPVCASPCGLAIAVENVGCRRAINPGGFGAIRGLIGELGLD